MKTLLITAALLSALPAFSQTNNNPLNAINYPELEVVPRASDRLEQEYRGEGSFKTYLPYYIAGAGALWAGTSHMGKYKGGLSDDDKKLSDLTATTVTATGVAWIGAALYLGSRRYYARALVEARNIKGTDKRSQLQKERLSEEALENAATLHRKMTYLLSGVQFVASVYQLSNWSTAEVKNSAIISALTALIPLVFPHEYVHHHQKHLEYKRKIYAPLVGMAPLFNQRSGMDGTQLSLAWEF